MENETATLAGLIVAGIALLKALEKLVNVVIDKVKEYKNGDKLCELTLNSRDIKDLKECLGTLQGLIDSHDKGMSIKIQELRDILNGMLKDDSNNAYQTEKALDKITEILVQLHTRQAIIESHLDNKP